jgi:hypothetical protein
MPIHVTFGHTERELLEAQWAAVDALEQALTDGWRYVETARTLRQLIHQSRSKARNPEQWAELFAEGLVETLNSLTSAAKSTSAIAYELERLSAERDRLHRIIDEQRADPLQERVRQLTEERDNWRQRAADQAIRVDQLEASLRHAEDQRQQQVSTLQATVADLNRIVADQQAQLNEHAD